MMGVYIAIQLYIMDDRGLYYVPFYYPAIQLESCLDIGGSLFMLDYPTIHQWDACKVYTLERRF